MNGNGNGGAPTVGAPAPNGGPSGAPSGDATQDFTGLGAGGGGPPTSLQMPVSRQLPPGSAAPQGAHIEDMLVAAHGTAAAMFNNTTKMQAKLNDVIGELGYCLGKGPQVTLDDVLEASSRLVASGHFSPMEMATLLADAPENGPGIEQWAQRHLSQAETNMMQIEQMHQLSRHEMGVSAIRLISHYAQQGQANLRAQGKVAVLTGMPEGMGGAPGAPGGAPAGSAPGGPPSAQGAAAPQDGGAEAPPGGE